MEDLELVPGRKIGASHPCFIIAEVGQNHQGDLETAKTLIRRAKESGADCVKFQKSCLHEKFTKKALDRPYRSNNSWGDTYGEHKKYLEFSDDDFVDLQSFAESLGIPFTSSAMDPVSLQFLLKLGTPFIKIGSGDADNDLLLEQAAKVGRPLVISTGMQTIEVVEHVYELVSQHTKKFVLLHCLSSYPAPLHDINLRVIGTYKELFPDVHVGYSGHETGFLPTLAAASLGARVIERHLTLDKNMKGSDHKSSLTPEEFKAMVKSIRELEVALGSGLKTVHDSELECWEKLGKSIVAGTAINCGESFTKDNLKIKVSCPKGLSAAKLRFIIGRKATRHVDEDEPITFSCVEAE